MARTLKAPQVPRIAAWVLLASLFALPAGAEVTGREVEYTAAGTTFRGYLALDDALAGARPGVLVVHEWWGHNEYARRRARMLAGLGYAALAVDMYGEGKQAAHPEDAGKFSGELMKNAALAKERFVAALEFLRSRPTVKKDRIAAVGYCFGGSVVLNMARAGLDLRGVASFHGGLAPLVEIGPGGIKAKLLVLHGADDSFVPREQVEAFKKEMAGAGADLTFIEYPGAVHSFTNPEADEFARKFGIPVGYNPEADRRSWEELKTFLAEVLR